MSAPLRSPVILTDAQFEDMTRKGAFTQVGRVELRGGVVVAMSPVYLNHAAVMFAMTQAVLQAVLAQTPDLKVLNDISIRFGAGFQPSADLVVYDPAAIPPGYNGPLPAEAVKLVVEVADASLADDLGQKLKDYAAAGLSEYWVADVAGRILHRCHTPTAEGYVARDAFRFGEAVAAVSLPLLVETQTL